MSSNHNCIKEIQDKVLEQFPIYNKKTVISVEADAVYKLPSFEKITFI